MSEVDNQDIVVGPPKSGKTTLILQRAHDFIRRGGWVFAHDVNGDYVPGGGKPGLCVAYRTVDEWRTRAESGQEMERGAAFSCASPAPITALVKELGDRHNTQHRVALPMMLIIDEASLLDTSGSSHAGANDVEVMTRRRHLGLYPVYNLQYPTLLTRAFYNMATDLFVFRQADDESIETLEKRASTGKGKLVGSRMEPPTACPPFRYWHVRKGVGFV